MKVKVSMMDINNVSVNLCDGQLDTCNNSNQPLIDTTDTNRLIINN